MKKILLAVNLCALFFISCKKETQILSADNSFTTFQITGAGVVEKINEDVQCTINDTLISGTTALNFDRTKLKASFSTTGVAVTVNGIQQESGVTENDFTKPIVYIITAQDGSQKRYTVKIRAFTGIPIIYLTTDEPVTSKEVYVNGTMKIDGNLDLSDGLYDGPITIKGRGNSTWVLDKKPYKIKLPAKSKILGMPADKEWALIANYVDKSLLRNDAAFELSERLGAAWTPRRKFVEVFLNGQYNGNYLLTETIKQSSDRVNIDLKNGGWLVEINHNESDGDPRFYIAEPELNVVTDVKEGSLDVSVIKSQLDAFYYKLNFKEYGADTGYQTIFDLDAYVTWYMVNEIMINNDAAFYSSVFIQRNNASSKIKMGPVWDFDLSSGNVRPGQTSPEGWYIANSIFANRLFEDPAFQQALKAKWNTYRSQIMNIDQYIDMKSKTLDLSAIENFKRWDILDVVFNNTVATFGTYQGEVSYFKDWLNRRIAWMDAEINK